MSNESSELTFVRCPQCRNLVPAVSTKCRRCGAGLEASAASPSGSESKVVHYPGGGDASSASAPKAKTNGNGHGNGNGHAAKPAPVVDSFQDPLADFLDQLEDAPQDLFDEKPVAAPSAAAAAKPAAKNVAVEANVAAEAASDDYNFDDFDDELKALFDESDDNSELDDLEETPVQPAPTKAPESKKIAATPVKKFVQAIPEEAEDDDFVEEQPKVAARPSRPKPFAEKRNEPIAAPPARAARQAVKPMPAPPVKAAYVEPEESDENYEYEEEVFEEELPVAKEKSKIPAKRVARDDFEDQGHEERAKTPEKVTSGTLVGWLVSFINPKGAAIELRTGKFFVSKSGVRKTDLVINHSSISSPHAMFNISSINSLQLQDLMSEQGLYIKKASGHSFRREEDVASLRHGDSVKFGEVEYLVSLLPDSE